jgi:threonine/homoserine efflux transporter RhtA
VRRRLPAHARRQLGRRGLRAGDRSRAGRGRRLCGLRGHREAAARPRRHAGGRHGRGVRDGALILLPTLAATPTRELFSAEGLALAGYLGAIWTTLAYILFAKGLEQVGASETATLTLAEPVTAMVLGFAVLGERPGPVAVAGAALVLAGLALLAVRAEYRRWDRTRAAEAAA